MLLAFQAVTIPTSPTLWKQFEIMIKLSAIAVLLLACSAAFAGAPRHHSHHSHSSHHSHLSAHHHHHHAVKR
ncbi:MAG TPA: hypothetical protein VKG05_06245 [Steroidobacteraceae bacterium]|nr:hypothetical protein [Steroidobacteraceae bacterium]